jgi:hypothetical protein
VEVGHKRGPPCTIRTDNALKVRFTATVGEEHEVELFLVNSWPYDEDRLDPRKIVRLGRLKTPKRAVC